MDSSALEKLISEGVDHAKLGKAVDIYNAVIPHFDIIPPGKHYGFGWVIYYALHQTADHDIIPRKEMLARYLRLSIPRPHKLHSMILTEAIRLYKNSRDLATNPSSAGRVIPHFSILRFSDIWNLDYLRPGDWRRKEHEGKMLNSTVEKLITHLADEIESSSDPLSPAVVSLMDRALEQYPDSYNLMTQRAAVHIKAGEHLPASALLRKALLLAPGKFHIWSRLASLIDESSEMHLKVALLAKALSAPGQPQFKGRIRIELARLWLAKGCCPEALCELQRVRDIYDLQGWHLPAACARLGERIPADTRPKDPSAAYRKLLPMADAYIYDSLPRLKVVKSFHKVPSPDDIARLRPGQRAAIAWRVTDDEGRNYWLQPHRYNLPPELPVGSQLHISLLNGRIVNAELI